MIRLFVGLKIPADVAAQLEIMCNGVPGARWVNPANMHLTLRFIGETEEQEAEEIDAHLSKVSAESFDLELRELGTFGRGRKIRALWVGVSASLPLNHLHAKIESAVVRSDQPSEKRKFTPHVTLARFSHVEPSRIESYLAGNNLFPARTFRVGEFTLFESSRGKGGPTYTRLTTYALS